MRFLSIVRYTILLVEEVQSVNLVQYIVWLLIIKDFFFFFFNQKKSPCYESKVHDRNSLLWFVWMYFELDNIMISGNLIIVLLFDILF